MAAVIHPDHRFRPAPATRPDLRLVVSADAADRRRSSLRDELGLSAAAVVATAIAFVVVMAGVLALGQGAFTSLAPEAPVAAPAPVVAGPGQQTVVVRDGDTLWSIARRLQPTGDVRPLVDQLVAANGSSLVAPGDQLVIDG